jgi:hypothetical protein
MEKWGTFINIKSPYIIVNYHLSLLLVAQKALVSLTNDEWNSGGSIQSTKMKFS